MTDAPDAPMLAYRPPASADLLPLERRVLLAAAVYGVVLAAHFSAVIVALDVIKPAYRSIHRGLLPAVLLVTECACGFVIAACACALLSGRPGFRRPLHAALVLLLMAYIADIAVDTAGHIWTDPGQVGTALLTVGQRLALLATPLMIATLIRAPLDRRQLFSAVRIAAFLMLVGCGLFVAGKLIAYGYYMNVSAAFTIPTTSQPLGRHLHSRLDLWIAMIALPACVAATVAVLRGCLATPGVEGLLRLLLLALLFCIPAVASIAWDSWSMAPLSPPLNRLLGTITLTSLLVRTHAALMIALLIVRHVRQSPDAT